MEEWTNTKQLLRYSTTPLLHYSKKNSAFTLLEVMIAVAVIAIVLVAVFGSQSQSITLANEAKFNTTAALLAQRKMAEIETADSLDLSSSSGDFGEDFPEYQWELNISEVPLPGTGEVGYLKQVDLAIRWGDKDQFRYGLRLYRFVPKAK
jgi:general secretion pathway protein I